MSRHATRIRADQSLWAIDWRELWEYRDLFRLLVRRDLTIVYKQSILGPLWFVLQPFLTTVVFRSETIDGMLAKPRMQGIRVSGPKRSSHLEVPCMFHRAPVRATAPALRWLSCWW